MEDLLEGDVGICLGLYEEYPVLKPLFERGVCQIREVGMVASRACLLTNKYLATEGCKPLFLQDATMYTVRMTRWHENLFGAMGEIAEYEKRKNN